MTAWAVCLALSGSAGRPAWASIRLEPGLECAQVDGLVWLRGRDLTEGLRETLRTLNCQRRYTWRGRDQLVEWGRRLPTATLPSGPWWPVEEVFPIELPPAAFSGQCLERVSLRLKRCGRERSPAIVHCTLEDWLEFVEAAPQWRLEGLKFAVSEDRRVLVSGQPLASIRGQYYILEQQVAWPVGWQWTLPLDAVAMPLYFSLSPDELALAFVKEPESESSDIEFETIPGSAWQKSERAAVRLTYEHLMAEP